MAGNPSEIGEGRVVMGSAIKNTVYVNTNVIVEKPDEDRTPGVQKKVDHLVTRFLARVVRSTSEKLSVPIDK